MKITINGRLPSLNEYIKACRANRYKGAEFKRSVQNKIIYIIKQQIKRPLKAPVLLSITWYEQNAKRDLDNICSAKKFILDALVQAGYLQDDGWKYVAGFEDRFFVDKANPRIEIEIKENGEWFYQALSADG